ncbi:MAG TPA: hypothetical protein DCL86_03030 [Bacteroidales bacterium]|nr:hypothetical protein [Bacteroidales bacterium]
MHFPRYNKSLSRYQNIPSAAGSFANKHGIKIHIFLTNNCYNPWKINPYAEKICIFADVQNFSL